MKTAKIKKVIMRAGVCNLWNHGMDQWVGTYGSIYALDGLPKLGLQHLPRILEIERDQWEALGSVEETYMDRDMDEMIAAAERGDEELRYMHPAPADIELFGSELVILQDGSFMVFLSAAQLAPININAQTRFLLWKAEGQEWIVVMDGLFAVALLRVSHLRQEAVTLLNEIAAAACCYIKEEE